MVHSQPLRLNRRFLNCLCSLPLLDPKAHPRDSHGAKVWTRQTDQVGASGSRRYQAMLLYTDRLRGLCSASRGVGSMTDMRLNTPPLLDLQPSSNLRQCCHLLDPHEHCPFRTCMCQLQWCMGPHPFGSRWRRLAPSPRPPCELPPLHPLMQIWRPCFGARWFWQISRIALHVSEVVASTTMGLTACGMRLPSWALFFILIFRDIGTIAHLWNSWLIATWQSTHFW